MPREKEYPGEEMENLTVFIPESWKEKLRVEAAIQKKSIATLVRAELQPLVDSIEDRKSVAA